MNDGISVAEWRFSICCFMMGSILRSSFLDKVTGNESFLFGVIGGVAFLPMMIIFIWLTRLYPGMNLFQMAECALGKVLGKIVGAMFILYFVSLGCVNLVDIGSFTSGYLMRNTPVVLMLAACGVTAAYILRKGVISLVHTIPMILTASILIFLLSIAQLMSRMDFNNLLPIFTLKPIKYIHGAMIAAAVPYGESLTLFALLPLVRPTAYTRGAALRHNNGSNGTKGKNGKNNKSAITKAIMQGALFSLVFMTMLHIREVTILGPLMSYATLPSFEIYRMIDTFSSLARAESLHGTVLITLMLIKVILIIYALVQGIASVFSLESEKPLILPVSMFVAVYAATFRLTPYYNMEWTINVSLFIWLAFEFALPFIILAAAFARRKHTRHEHTHEKESEAIA